MLKSKIFLSFAICGLFLLSGCGFTPVHGNHVSRETTSDLLSNIEIAMIPEESGVNLRNELMDRMYKYGRPSAPEYKLSVGTIREVKAGIGIAKDASVTRSQLRLYAKMNLVKIDTNEVVLTREISAFTSYNVLDSHFTTLVSEREARHNGVIELAEQALLQLDLYFSSPERMK
jgi:hypothetical protein